MGRGIQREPRPGGVLLGHHRDGQGPRDPQGGIVVAQSPLRTGGVELRNEIEDFRIVHERLEPVGQAPGHVERATILSAQLHADPLAHGGRPRPQIDDHIVDGAADAADQFHLFVRRHLVVQTAEGPGAPVVRDIPLNKPGFQVVVSELPLVPGTRKEPALILALVEVDDVRSWESGFFKVHSPWSFRSLPAPATPGPEAWWQTARRAFPGGPGRHHGAGPSLQARSWVRSPLLRSRCRTLRRESCESRKPGSLNPIDLSPALSRSIVVGRSSRGWWFGASFRKRLKSTRYERLSGGAFLLMARSVPGTLPATASASAPI